MMDDSMYPNDGSYYVIPDEPEDQQKEKRASRTKSQAAKPLILDLIAQIDADLARMKSVDSIHVTAEDNPEDFMKVWYAIQQVAAYAEEKKAYLESLLLDTK